MPENGTSAQSSRLVRFCLGLWRILLYIWGTLIVGIVVSTIANYNTTTTDTPLSKLYLVHDALTYPIPTFASLGALVLLTITAWFGSREKKAVIPHPLSMQERIHVLGRLRLRYEQMQAQSLQDLVQIELGLASRPAAIQNAASLSLRLPDQPEQLLPSHFSIVDAYEQAQQELLILGEPGAGKSTLLLELAHHLVEQAEQDTKQPLPVLLPLSSWATNRLPLQEWLSEQFVLLYDVPRNLSRQWIQAEQLLFLLDGLDEMGVSARTACITAINAYHREHLQPLVICSRTNEYDTASQYERLALHNAVVAQPLSLKLVDTYLKNIGNPLVALRAALKKNPILAEIATTPLMLQVLILAYQDTSVRELSNKETLLQQQVWDDFVQRMVSRKGDKNRYPLSITTTWLGHLAQQMREHNQTIFFLERLQPDWLYKKKRVLYQWSVGLSVGLSGGLDAVIQHCILRFWLWHTHLFPWGRCHSLKMPLLVLYFGRSVVDIASFIVSYWSTLLI